jgi:hypothetical protein
MKKLRLVGGLFVFLAASSLVTQRAAAAPAFEKGDSVSIDQITRQINGRDETVTLRVQGGENLMRTLVTCYNVASLGDPLEVLLRDLRERNIVGVTPIDPAIACLFIGD